MTKQQYVSFVENNTRINKTPEHNVSSTGNQNRRKYRKIKPKQNRVEVLRKRTWAKFMLTNSQNCSIKTKRSLFTIDTILFVKLFVFI